MTAVVQEILSPSLEEKAVLQAAVNCAVPNVRLSFAKSASGPLSQDYALKGFATEYGLILGKSQLFRAFFHKPMD